MRTIRRKNNAEAPATKGSTCFVGLDLSLVSTGYVEVLQGGDGRPLRAENIGNKKVKGAARLLWLRQAIMGAIGSRPEGYAGRKDVMLVALEGYSYGSHSSNLPAIGELGGVARVALHEANVPFIVVPPSTLKKFATGRGNAKKDEMMLEVYKRWNYSPANNDVADAYALAAFAAAYSGMAWWKLPQWQRDALSNYAKNSA